MPGAIRRRGTAQPPHARGSFGRLALLLASFVAVVLPVYAPALRGEFVGDDAGYVFNNPYVTDPTPRNLVEILDPWGASTAHVANYAPVTVLLHAAEWRLFGWDVLGYHMVNVVSHALASLLVVLMFESVGIARVPAFLGGLVFLLHPANVEAVAWVSQLRTIAALALAIGALLAHPRRPILGVILFALALCTKAAAAFALPTALAFAWVRLRDGSARRTELAWLAVWGLAFVLFSVPQFAAFQRMGQAAAPLDPDPLVQLRTLLAFGARYLAMAATAHGVCAFQQPGPVRSLLDPWWLAGLVAALAFAWRAVTTLRRGSVEAGFWVWGAFAYAPVSQVFPFLFPVADRYLYVVLPALIGIVLLIGREALAWIAARRAPELGGGPRPRQLARVGSALAVVLAGLFAARSLARAEVWGSDLRVTLDSARCYPDGLQAQALRARRAAQEGDVEGALAALRAAAQRGLTGFNWPLEDPGLAPLHGDPRFHAFVAELARDWIEAVGRRERPTQMELRGMAHAYGVLGDAAMARQMLERSLAVGGPLDPMVQSELEALRALTRSGPASEPGRRGSGPDGSHGISR